MKYKISFLAMLFFSLSCCMAQVCTTCNGRGYLEQSTTCGSCQYGYVQSTVKRDCTRCYGAGTISERCSKCSGRRVQIRPTQKVCSYCNGSTYVKSKVKTGQCKRCMGTGNTEQRIGGHTPGTRCPDCNGEGCLYEIQEIHCPHCVRGYVSSSEQIPCSQCNGNGTETKTCPQCGGRRQYTETTTTPCSACGGTGNKTVRNTCPTCHGSGKAR